jgi:hypothetical protein
VTGLDGYGFGLIAEAEHEVSAGGNIEHEDT